jgi:hypothetical protein
MKRFGILIVLASFAAALVGCSTGEVSASDIQKNMKDSAAAAKKDPGDVGVSN